MATYKVLSDRLTGLSQDSTVSLEQLPDGLNVEALVAGGHLAEVGKVQEMKATEVKSTEVKKLDKE